jgi:sugar lactone lactonase YvrE
MKRSAICVLVVFLLIVQGLWGVNPQKWDIYQFSDLLKGKFDGISVSYDGRLSLSPEEEKIEGPSDEFNLSFLITSDGTAYIGTGHQGNIYRRSKDGKIELYYRVPEVDIYCLAMDSQGNLYAGTSPNGKIYKVTGKGEGETFFNPSEKYIWDLLFIDDGILLAAVGESGGIYEIGKQGEGRLMLNAEENHILCLNQDRSGNVYAGSGGAGHLYKITPRKKASILFESAYEEIKSITLDNGGNIYAAACGNIIRPEKEAVPSISTPAQAADASVTVTVTPTSSTTAAQTLTASGEKQPSALYKINPNGIAKKLWQSQEELIYSLYWKAAERKLYFGTGDKGRIYSVDWDNKISLLLQKNSEQVYLLAPSESNIFVLSNNPSEISILSPEQRLSGEYLSCVYDAKMLSSWGRMNWETSLPEGTILQCQTRSGNSSEPNQTWSDWSPPYSNRDGEQILNPRARYIQFKIIFKTQSGSSSPSVQRITMFYSQANVPPVINKLELLPSNEVFIKPPDTEDKVMGAAVSSSEMAQKLKKDTTSFMVAKKVNKKGFQTVTWDSADENGDSLLYSIFIKNENETRWHILQNKWVEKVFAFDTLSFPDGLYRIKISASDLPSNPIGKELNSEKISRLLTIDNSLPVIRNFSSKKERDKLVVTFSAEDVFSYIKGVKFLIRPDEWRSLVPEDGICDSKREVFNVSIPLTASSDNLITVKVIDSRDNVVVFRQTF